MEVSLNICIAFVKLEISQLPMSWLKALASQNIHTIVVTLLTIGLLVAAVLMAARRYKATITLIHLTQLPKKPHYTA
jgi:hypothetical protein